MSITTKILTLYGYKCEACGHEVNVEDGGYDKCPNFCGKCGTKLSADDNQPHNTDNA
jgi:predicted nucleic acid-binding Zn ribbon protein